MRKQSNGQCCDKNPESGSEIFSAERILWPLDLENGEHFDNSGDYVKSENVQYLKNAEQQDVYALMNRGKTLSA